MLLPAYRLTAVRLAGHVSLEASVWVVTLLLRKRKICLGVSRARLDAERGVRGLRATIGASWDEPEEALSATRLPFPWLSRGMHTFVSFVLDPSFDGLARRLGASGQRCFALTFALASQLVPRWVG
jgi:hypothetical protein